MFNYKFLFTFEIRACELIQDIQNIHLQIVNSSGAGCEWNTKKNHGRMFDVEHLFIKW